MEKYMAQAQRIETNDDQQQESIAKKTPKDRARHGNVEIAIWPNEGKNGTFYSASTPTITYKDEQGQIQKGSSYGRHDLLDLAEAAREAAITLRDLNRSKTEGLNR
jgi:hypothetical protein